MSACKDCPFASELRTCATVLRANGAANVSTLATRRLMEAWDTKTTEAASNKIIPIGSVGLRQPIIDTLRDALPEPSPSDRDLTQQRLRWADELEQQAERLPAGCNNQPKHGIRIPLTNAVIPLSLGPRQCQSRFAPEARQKLRHARSEFSELNNLPPESALPIEDELFAEPQKLAAPPELSIVESKPAGTDATPTNIIHFPMHRLAGNHSTPPPFSIPPSSDSPA